MHSHEHRNGNGNIGNSSNGMQFDTILETNTREIERHERCLSNVIHAQQWSHVVSIGWVAGMYFSTGEMTLGPLMYLICSGAQFECDSRLWGIVDRVVICDEVTMRETPREQHKCTAWLFVSLLFILLKFCGGGMPLSSIVLYGGCLIVTTIALALHIVRTHCCGVLRRVHYNTRNALGRLLLEAEGLVIVRHSHLFKPRDTATPLLTSAAAA
jgi:hypothetical protein